MNTKLRTTQAQHFHDFHAGDRVIVVRHDMERNMALDDGAVARVMIEMASGTVTGQSLDGCYVQLDQTHDQTAYFLLYPRLIASGEPPVVRRSIDFPAPPSTIVDTSAVRSEAARKAVETRRRNQAAANQVTS